MPRMGLNRQRVVAQAAAVADEAGLDRLTLSAVAKRLGVSLPACTSTSTASTGSSATWRSSACRN